MKDSRVLSTIGRIWDRLQRIPKPWRMVVGLVFVALGLLGLVLPVLQGILFLAIGVSLLAGDSRWVRAKVAMWLASHGLEPVTTTHTNRRDRSRSEWISLDLPHKHGHSS